MKEMNYSSEVYELRKKRGVSQCRMAEELAISRRALSKIENSEQNLSLGMAYRISAYLGKMVYDVFPVTDFEPCSFSAATPDKERSPKQMDNQREIVLGHYLDFMRHLDRMENKFLSIGVNVSEDATGGTDTVGRDCIDAMNEFGAVLYSLYKIDVNGEGFYDVVVAYSNGKCDKKEAIEKLVTYGR